MRVVALAGLAGSGKSTAAKILIDEGFTLVKFAGPLKDMLRGMGLGERELEGDLKEKPCDMLGGKTPRHAMQTLGTEWGRRMLADNLWVKLWAMRVSAVLSDGGRVICDDCRFENEWRVLKEFEGSLIHLSRDGAGVTDGSNLHASEKGGLPADYYLTNNASVEMLRQHLLQVVAK